MVAQTASHPTELSGAASLAYTLRYFLDPIETSEKLSGQYGTFVRFHNRFRLGNLPSDIIFAARPSLYREILGRPAIWRTVSIAASGRRGHASRRLSNGIVRMQGKRHAHYRRLIVPPLRQASVSQLGADMVQTASSVVSRWPTGEVTDLWAHIRKLMRGFAIAHLFGADHKNGEPIAEQINEMAAESWALGTNILRFNIPGSKYAKGLKRAEELERAIIAWARSKEGALDPHDLLSIIVNNADENGFQPSEALLSGHVPTLFGAAYETCQIVMIWTLVLIARHPEIAANLRDEITQNSGDGPADFAALNDLPLLDRVVKESMRVLPPVPNQYRVALEDTALSDVEIRKKSRAILSAFILNRDPDIYPEPRRFLPGRWEGIDPTPFEYAAFSAGPRSCPGYFFGMSVVKVALATILSKYSIAFAENQKIDYRVGVTLRPSSGVMVILRPLQEGRSLAPVAVAGQINRLVQFSS